MRVEQLDWLADFGSSNEPSPETKQCLECKKYIKIELFELKTTYLSGYKYYSSICKSCKKNSNRVINKLKRNFLPPPPGTKCAVPNCANEATCLDHDHITETRREYICIKHNTAFAFCGDNVAGVIDLLEYAKRWEK